MKDNFVLDFLGVIVSVLIVLGEFLFSEMIVLTIHKIGPSP